MDNEKQPPASRYVVAARTHDFDLTPPEQLAKFQEGYALLNLPTRYVGPVQLSRIPQVVIEKPELPPYSQVMAERMFIPAIQRPGPITLIENIPAPVAPTLSKSAIGQIARGNYFIRALSAKPRNNKRRPQFRKHGHPRKAAGRHSLNYYPSTKAILKAANQFLAEVNHDDDPLLLKVQTAFYQSIRWIG